MQEYSIKRACDKKSGRNLGEMMVEGLRTFFDAEPRENDAGHYVISYGILKHLEVWLGEKGKTLCVDTETDKSADDDAAILDTNRRFRNYLEYVTCLSAKERGKRMQKGG